jgi:hypothetical protein
VLDSTMHPRASVITMPSGQCSKTIARSTIR